MRSVLTTLAECAGFVAVALGVGFFDWRAGVVMAGGSLIAVGVSEGRK